VGLSYVPVPWQVLACGTARQNNTDVPLKCCSSLISRSARLARIFLLKTLVTFLMATPSPVWLLVAALWAYYQHLCALHCPRVLPDNAVCALSQLLGHIVALVDDELLVEDLPQRSVLADYRQTSHGIHLEDLPPC
jgi:hypothetical protein